MAKLFPDQSIPYPSFLYATMIDGLRRAYAQHPDPAIAQTMVIYEYTTDEVKYPLMIVRYYGRDIKNSGVGNKDTLTINGEIQAFEHYYYEGDIEFEIQTMDPLSRDRMAGSLVTLITSGSLGSWMGEFFDRVYGDLADVYPYRNYNFVNINSDELTPFGNVTVPAPWNAENELLFKTTYRTNILGEFTSLPNLAPLTAAIEKVLLYPYSEIEGDPVPDLEDPDGAIVIPPSS
jgi:hypothetical protein